MRLPITAANTTFMSDHFVVDGGRATSGHDFVTPRGLQNNRVAPEIHPDIQA